MGSEMCIRDRASRARCAAVMAAVFGIAAALEYPRFCLAISLVEIGGIADPKTSTVAID